MALTAEDVVTMLDSSFTGCDSSDDDLGMSIEEIENPHFDPDQGKQNSNILDMSMDTGDTANLDILQQLGSGSSDDSDNEAGWTLGDRYQL